jgi:co-chaperonin GroES (HSP10)
MTLHAIQKSEKVAISNQDVFSCSREELLELLNSYDFGQAANYRLTVAIPPERETTKGGIILTKNNSETEQNKTSIGRIISLGSTVGDNPSLRDCKDLKIGDYVKFNYYAAGLPDIIEGVLIKYLVDDMVIAIHTNPGTISMLYDYRR